MLLLTLEYLREYRTYFHIGQAYGVHETTAIRIHRWVEEVLIKEGTFSLPGKKALLSSNIEYTVIQIDATESPVERPKKQATEEKANKKPEKQAKKVLFKQEKTSYYENASCS